MGGFLPRVGFRISVKIVREHCRTEWDLPRFLTKAGVGGFLPRVGFCVGVKFVGEHCEPTRVGDNGDTPTKACRAQHYVERPKGLYGLLDAFV